MSEIVGLHLGQFGARVGQQFWKQIAQQHNINNSNQKGDAHGKLIFFQEKKQTGHYPARSIFFDMQSRSNDHIIKNDSYLLHDPKNFKMTSSQSRGLWSQANYVSGADKKADFEDVLRRTVQKCNCLSGFITTNSMGEGSGSGLGSLISLSIRQNFGCMIQCYSLYPEINLYTNPLQVYNSIFATHYLIQQANLVTIIDNYSANKIIQNQGKRRITHQDNNKLFGRAISEITSSFRFSGKLNSSQRKLITNLVMFPRLMFMHQTMSEQQCSRFQHPVSSALQGTKRYLGGQAYSMGSRFFQMSIHCRDPIAYEQQIYRQAQKSLQKKYIPNTHWIPSNFHMSLCDEINLRIGKSASVLVSSNSVREMFQQLSDRFSGLFHKKAYIHHYLACGIDQMEFIEMESNTNDLISQFTQYCGSPINDQEFIGDDENIQQE